MVQFYQSVSCSSSVVHGSCRSFGSSCSSVAGSVHGSVGSVVQSVYVQLYLSLSLTSIPVQSIKHVSRLFGFFTNGATPI